MSQMFGRRNGVDEELLEAKSPGAARRPAEAPKTTSPKASSSNAGSSNGAAATENVGAGPRPAIKATGYVGPDRRRNPSDGTDEHEYHNITKQLCDALSYIIDVSSLTTTE